MCLGGLWVVNTHATYAFSLTYVFDFARRNMSDSGALQKTPVGCRWAVLFRCQRRRSEVKGNFSSSSSQSTTKRVYIYT